MTDWEDTDLWQGIQDAMDDKFVRPAREPYPDDIEEGWPDDDKELPIEDTETETDWKEPYPDDIDVDG